jgi:purine-nucleoside phosphorylase
MPDPMVVAARAAGELRRRSGGRRFDVAVVLGSGWKEAAGSLGDVRLDVAASELAGFPPSAVAGHEGRIEARERGERVLLVFKGRAHLYEGLGMDAVVHGVRTAVAAGCRTIVLTNAAGAIDPELAPGRPVLVSDHISLTAASPLRGPQFVDLSGLYSPRLRALAREVDPTLREGVYAHWPGPAYETPAEIRMLRTLGADLVGMSTVPEAIAAHALGAEVLALSLVTNLAAGLGEGRLSHEEVIAVGQGASGRCGELLLGILGCLS